MYTINESENYIRFATNNVKELQAWHDYVSENRWLAKTVARKRGTKQIYISKVVFNS